MSNILTRQARDPRLDFFRGAGLLIIFIAHFQGGWLWNYIPARFGLSDAADLFVFCSGYAAALAFGGTYARRGFWLGTARIALRCWQLYIAHIALFICVVAAGVAISGAGETSHLRLIGLHTLFADAPAALLGLATLTFVPNYFDILPLYIVVLALVPIAMVLARVSPVLVIAASLGLYAASWGFGLNLPADPLLNRSWYFNPFCWQLIFFTGFAFGRGWLVAPLQSRLATGTSLALVAIGLAVSLPSIIDRVPIVAALAQFFQSHSDKTYLDLWRYAHFLATAQLAIVFLRDREQILFHPLCRPLCLCGRQALSVFLSGMVLSHLCSMLLVILGDRPATQLLLNGSAVAILVGVAYAVAWFKSQPWSRTVKGVETAGTPRLEPAIGATLGHASALSRFAATGAT